MTGLFLKQLVRNCLSKSQTISFSKIKKTQSIASLPDDVIFFNQTHRDSLRSVFEIW